MWPTLGWGSLTMIQRNSQLDTSGMVRTAQMLSRMPTPWSTNFMSNAPQGESFWSIPAISQGFQLGLQWLFVRIIPPTTAVNYWILIGWVLTGFVVYLLSMQVGISRLFAVFAGISCEMLPWIREQVNTHTSYVFLCVPLFVLYTSIRWVNSNTKKNTVLFASSLSISVLFDLYWAYSSLIIVLIVFSVNAKNMRGIYLQLQFKTRIIICSLISVCFAVGVAGYIVVKRALSSSGSMFRPLAIGDIGFIDEFNGSILRYVTPDYLHRFAASSLQKSGTQEDIITYTGIVIVGLAFLGIFNILKKQHLKGKELIWVTVFFTVLTIPSAWVIGFLEVSTPINWLRFLMPGVRVFSRAGLIVEPLICVAAAIGVSRISMRMKSKFSKYLVVAVTIAFVSLDLNPTSRRYVNEDAVQYSSINRTLGDFLNPVVIEFPADLNKLYFPVHYVDAPKASSLSDAQFYDKVMLAASLGEEELAAYLKEIGVTHLVVPTNSEGEALFKYKWNTRASIEIDLNDSRFSRVSDAGGVNPAALFELRAKESDQNCISCKPYRIEWSNAREGFYRFVSDGRNVFYEDGQDLSWAYPTDNPKLVINPIGGGDSTYRLTIHFVAAFGVNAPPQVLAIDDGEALYSVPLTAGPGTDFQIDLKAGQEISLRSVLPCAKVSVVDPGNPDARTLCFGISSIKVEQK